ANNGFIPSVPPRDSNPIPSEPGVASQQIKHVIFINKENATHDLILGDITKTRQGLPVNGDPDYSLGYVGSPNHHELALRFAFSDNFFLEPSVSSDGHRWLTNTYTTEFEQTHWPASYGGKRNDSAIELNPGYATAHHWYAWHLSLLGRYDEAFAEMRKAQELDPLSLIINADLAEILVLAHAYDESIRQSQKTLEMDANFALAHNQLAQAYLGKHMYEEAVAELLRAVQLSSESPTCVANLARAYALSGKKSEAVKLLNDLKKRSNSGH